MRIEGGKARSVVESFLKNQEDLLEENVVDYVCGILCTDGQEVPSVEEVVDLVSGFCPETFGKTNTKERYDSVSRMMEEVERIRSKDSKETHRSETKADGIAEVLEACLVQSRLENEANDVPLTALCTMFDGEVQEEDVRFVLHHLCDGDWDRAAEWILETRGSADLAKKLRKCHEEEQNAMREKIVARYALVPTSNTTSASSKQRLSAWNNPEEGKNARLRWRDGVVVSTRGEKIIYESIREEWDGGSRGKVKLKGKRGKGWA